MSSEILDNANEVLKKHWGYESLKKAQGEIIVAALEGKDVLAVLPTGYGKSATYQIPAMLCNGTAIVVSPLIALMKDQCDDCQKRGIPASYVNSHISDKEVHQRFSDLAAGCYKVFYIAPERLSSASFRETIGATDVSFIVVDEAHCVSRWGHDFRPAYLKVKTLVLMCTANDMRPPLIAVTATATKDIESDIMYGCGIETGYTRVVGDPIRANLKYRVVEGNAWNNLRSLLDSFDVKTGRYIIYCGTQKGCEKVAEIAEQCVEGEDVVGFYHAGMPREKRIKAQDDFKSGVKPVIIATCAFGMGIDVPNIRSVIHFGIPGTLEDYCQESGRAGRDGKSADVVLIHDEFAVNLKQRFLDLANPPYSVYQLVWDWLHENLKPGEVMNKSGIEIAQKISAQHDLDIPGDQVLGALSTMDAYGLLMRRQAAGAVTLRIRRDALSTFLKSNIQNPLLRKVATYLQHDILDILAGPNETSCVIDQTIAAETLDMSPSTFDSMCTLLEKHGAVTREKSFHGKSTQIVKYGAVLADLLPREKIEDKRDREQQRLDDMIGYTKTRDRISYIRNYFLSK